MAGAGKAGLPSVCASLSTQWSKPQYADDVALTQRPRGPLTPKSQTSLFITILYGGNLHMTILALGSMSALACDNCKCTPSSWAFSSDGFVTQNKLLTCSNCFKFESTSTNSMHTIAIEYIEYAKKSKYQPEMDTGVTLQMCTMSVTSK
ncbi:hypothetical protein J6590_042760 [Homalodisca vitripennis]|nr:hypothetical protein J6590_042760 [Homalodisca vitripennis]